MYLLAHSATSLEILLGSCTEAGSTNDGVGAFCLDSEQGDGSGLTLAHQNTGGGPREHIDNEPERLAVIGAEVAGGRLHINVRFKAVYEEADAVPCAMQGVPCSASRRCCGCTKPLGNGSKAACLLGGCQPCQRSKPSVLLSSISVEAPLCSSPAGHFSPPEGRTAVTTPRPWCPLRPLCTLRVPGSYLRCVPLIGATEYCRMHGSTEPQV